MTTDPLQSWNADQSGDRVSRHQRGVLQAESFMAAEPSVPADKVDLAILFSSWDRRCLCVTKTALIAETIVVVIFDGNDEEGNDLALLQFASQSGTNVVTVRGRSDNIRDTWPKLRDEITAAAARTSVPMTMVVDLAAASRFYALGAIAEGFAAGTSVITVLYAEGNYPDESSETDRHELFTQGRWETVGVPGLIGSYDPSNMTTWLVSIGFEGSKTARAVGRADPDRLSILVADPAANAEYVERTWRNNTWLEEDYAIPSERIVKSEAGDAVAAWKALDKASIDDFDHENVSYVCAGSKPHALGMALRALSTGKPSVVYLKPDRHKVVRVEPSGRYWTYRIADLSQL